MRWLITWRSGIFLGGAMAFASTLRLISCRQERMWIFSLVFWTRLCRPSAAVAMARRRLEHTMTELSTSLSPRRVRMTSRSLPLCPGWGPSSKNSCSSRIWSIPSSQRDASRNTESGVWYTRISFHMALARRTKKPRPKPRLNTSFHSDSPCLINTTFRRRRFSTRSRLRGSGGLFHLKSRLSAIPIIPIVHTLCLYSTFASRGTRNAMRYSRPYSSASAPRASVHPNTYSPFPAVSLVTRSYSGTMLNSRSPSQSPVRT
mmetsp:Transcript_35998/g.101353  ORF Transcript_35998/g.101353 Transcript_35998/m.101353 type:complete len:260 (+) Transcript_35998:379-1158(+)